LIVASNLGGNTFLPTQVLRSGAITMASEPALPIPISLTAGKYLLFSIDAVTYLRREHHICGVFIGALPTHPQQNVFLGLPMQLMPEEARLLVDKKVAYIVDDVQNHKDGITALVAEDRRRYLDQLKKEGEEASKSNARSKEKKREKRLKELNINPPQLDSSQASSSTAAEKEDECADSDLLFDAGRTSSLQPSTTSLGTQVAFAVTPTMSHPLVAAQPNVSCAAVEVPASYPLFAHLHSKGYFISPGLRFGCQYLAYPGDPLRFHSHFLAVGLEWDEEIDLMKVVGGGRLGTGVKKGFLLGAADNDQVPGDTGSEAVRTFSIEWAGM